MTGLRIEKQVEVAVSPAAVFEALTVPSRIKEIFPLDEVEIQPRVGGQIAFRGKAGGAAFLDVGRIEHFDPPNLFQYRYWSDNHGTSRSSECVLRYELAEAPGGGTIVRVIHSDLPGEDYRSAMDGAWNDLLAALRSALEA